MRQCKEIFHYNLYTKILCHGQQSHMVPPLFQDLHPGPRHGDGCQQQQPQPQQGPRHTQRDDGAPAAGASAGALLLPPLTRAGDLRQVGQGPGSGG